MTDVFINSLQLNDSTITCNVTGHKLEKRYNNQTKEIYSRVNTMHYNTSGGPEEYKFDFTLWGRGDIYEDLLIKQEAVYNELKSQVLNRLPIRITTDDTPICMSATGVVVVVDSADFSNVGSDGPYHLNFSLECTLIDVLSDQVVAGWEKFQVNQGMVGDSI